MVDRVAETAAAVEVVADAEVDAVAVDEPLVGVGFRRELSGWLTTAARGVGCLEITAEHFFHGNYGKLEQLADNYELYVHGLGASLGSPGPLDADYLKRFAAVAEAARAAWVSEHISYTRFGGTDLGHLTPVRPTRQNAELIADHARQLADFCEKPILLENITSYVRLEGDMPEPEFLNLICDRADCGLLLDVTNLYINSRNHGFDPLEWLAAVDASRIRQLHIVGYAERNGRLDDDHGAAIQPELLNLMASVLAVGHVRGIILERDTNFPQDGEMQKEIDKIVGVFPRG